MYLSFKGGLWCYLYTIYTWTILCSFRNRSLASLTPGLRFIVTIAGVCFPGTSRAQQQFQGWCDTETHIVFPFLCLFSPVTDTSLRSTIFCNGTSYLVSSLGILTLPHEDWLHGPLSVKVLATSFTLGHARIFKIPLGFTQNLARWFISGDPCLYILICHKNATAFSKGKDIPLFHPNSNLGIRNNPLRLLDVRIYLAVYIISIFCFKIKTWGIESRRSTLKHKSSLLLLVFVKLPMV